MDELLWRATWERVHSLASCTTFNPLVATIDLSPGFLKNEDPNFVYMIRALRWLREGPPTVLLIVRKVVIDDYCTALTIDVHLNGVTARIVDLWGQKDPLYPIRILSEGWQRRKIITITTTTLSNIWWARYVKDDIVMATVYFFRPFPCVISPLQMPTRCINRWV